MRHLRKGLGIIAVLVVSTSLWAASPASSAPKEERIADPCLDFVWGDGHLTRATRATSLTGTVHEISIDARVELREGCTTPDPGAYRLHVLLLDGRQVEVTPTGVELSPSKLPIGTHDAWFVNFELSLGSQVELLDLPESQQITTGYTGDSVWVQARSLNSRGGVVDHGPDDGEKLCLPGNPDPDCGAGGGGTYWR
jgi:hypothetical protein